LWKTLGLSQPLVDPLSPAHRCRFNFHHSLLKSQRQRNEKTRGQTYVFGSTFSSSLFQNCIAKCYIGDTKKFSCVENLKCIKLYVYKILYLVLRVPFKKEECQGLGCGSVVKCLPNMFKALGSISNTA
jgi:hypothetical protein